MRVLVALAIAPNDASGRPHHRQALLKYMVKAVARIIVSEIFTCHTTPLLVSSRVASDNSGNCFFCSLCNKYNKSKIWTGRHRLERATATTGEDAMLLPRRPSPRAIGAKIGEITAIQMEELHQAILPGPAAAELIVTARMLTTASASI